MEFKRHYTTVDAHVAGEPLRLITGGLPSLDGNVIGKNEDFRKKQLDSIRHLLMNEPRGHPGMVGCVKTPPASPDADFGVIFMDSEGYSAVCGHGIIAVVTMAVEMGWVETDRKNPRMVMDTSAGKIVAAAQVEGAEVTSVSFENVPSFVYVSDVPLSFPERKCTVDIAFGGAFYALVDASDLGVRVELDQLVQLKGWGRRIQEQVEFKMRIQHPLKSECTGLHGVVITDRPQKPDSDLRNVTIFSGQRVDRSPCGTGISAQMAALFQKGAVKKGEELVHESLIGSQFFTKVTRTARVDGYTGIVPSVTGRAFITGIHHFVLDPDDPLHRGFLVR
ncbi:proline racemase family protein [Desmospora profundinema]|uniref:Proline racemase n=1 Tax=Desmospora profundinema TaxID=1571184 RepID=A0ABU1IJF8_9BACL|nr:proline racemase family protein [Desmospora profundinema]MDR6224910.1 proline racemase [Desmospora profundinema]